MLNIVECPSKPGEQQDYFAIRDNPYSALVEGQIRRFENTQRIVAEAKDGIKNARVREKLTDLERFYKLYRESSLSLFDALQASPLASRKAR